MARGRVALRQAALGQGAVLAIQGPAGSGKSHLADDLVAYALARDYRVLFSECYSYTADSPYVPWISLLQNLAGISGGDNRDVSSQKLHHLLAGLGLDNDDYTRPLANLLGVRSQAAGGASRALGQPPAPAAAPAQAPRGSSLFGQLGQKLAAQKETAGPAGGDGQGSAGRSNLLQLAQERQQGRSGQLWRRLQSQIAAREQVRLYRAMHGLFWHLSARGPLLLLFENAQWLDAASQALLDDVSQRLDNASILILVVKRQEGSDPPAGAGLLALGPLPPEGTAGLVAHLLDSDPPAELIEVIHQQSHGNPLYVLELVDWIQCSGQHDPAQLKNRLQESTTVQELLLSHVDRLSPDQRDVVKAAAIIGSSFACGELLALTAPDLDERSLRTSLAGLEQARLALQTEAGDDPRYVFQQTLIREVIYNSLSFSRRRDQHGVLAAYLEKRHAGDREQAAELLAYHFEQAQQWLPAARYLLLAGHKARQRFAYAQATTIYGRAMAAVTRLPKAEAGGNSALLKAQIHEAQGDVALVGDDPTTAAWAYVSAGHTLAAAGLESPTGLLLKLALTLPTQGETAAATGYATQVLAGQPGQAEELAARATLAWMAWRDRPAEAGEQVRAALELASRQNSPWAAGVQALLADLSGDWSTALEAYTAFERPAGVILAACRLGDRALQQGDPAGALAFYNQAAEALPNDAGTAGAALVAYRRAEGQWRFGGDLPAARSNLEKASQLLAAGRWPMPAERRLVDQALALLAAGDESPWPAWQWRYYDDILRTALLFRPEATILP
ncbi:MAG: AAA family ATPase [Chloroflexi bacterium]|nr:AAA family ATPase [Chloroflexota bacterium]MCI0578107.1 AAA family ATPase [Chloroflexota bacterium]MCI0644411.1 AAA family ATPase [Chloroflexota bacterium]MCI0727921.1 AAA family ATPase [Chloroflexota bacterium]